MASSSSSASALVAEEEDMADDATAWAWLAEAGFAEGDLRSEITINERMKCPMIQKGYNFYFASFWQQYLVA